MRTVATWAAALGTLAFVGSLSAHHSISMFDIGKPIWIKGTIVRFERVNPHVLFTLEQTQDDGQLRHWTIEGPGLNSFNRAGLGDDFVRPGDVVEVCGFGFKDEVLARNAGLDPRGRARPGLHGHVLVMAGGRMRLFGGYGKIDNCVRPDDDAQIWLAFLNTDARARNAWCNGRNFLGFPSLAPKPFVDEVDRRLTNPCPQPAK